MKTIEYHLPCYGKGVYTFFKEHDRNNRPFELIINNTKYIFHYCQSCIYAQSQLNTTYYGFYVILMNYVFNECGIFEPIKIEFNNKGLIKEYAEVMKWFRNTDYYSNKEMKSNQEYMEIDHDSYNTFYAKRKHF
ncbi:MAG: hypothetical protein PHS30_06920 [Bacteroidales bacterium]|nr:hypothetical protein [Bacteroidales bacterium]